MPRLPNVKVCGKTGTAQLAATELTKKSKDLKNNAWFVAFAPGDNPEIVVAGLYENGEESYNTVPIVRDVLKAYFDKKERNAKAPTSVTRLVAPSARSPGAGSRAAETRVGRLSTSCRPGAAGRGRQPLVAAYRSLRDLDWTLVFIALALCCLGVLQIYSATNGSKWQGAWWRQIIYVVTGFIMMWVVAQIDYHSLMGKIFPIYAAAVVLLMLTFLLGDKVFGSTRWIKVSGFTLQTSEFVKIVLVLLVARYLGRS